jgi:hypothetical protein
VAVVVRKVEADHSRIRIVRRADEQLLSSRPVMDDTDPISVFGGEIKSETNSRKGSFFDPGQLTNLLVCLSHHPMMTEFSCALGGRPSEGV